MEKQDSHGVTIRELAELAGVSTATVSNVIHGKTKRVSPGTIRRVQELILAMGCCTNSNFAGQYHLPGTFAPIADFGLLEAAAAQARSSSMRMPLAPIPSMGKS